MTDTFTPELIESIIKAFRRFDFHVEETGTITFSESEVKSFIEELTASQWKPQVTGNDVYLIKEALDYDPESGIIKWKQARSGIRVGQIAGAINHYGYINIQVKGKTYPASSIAWVFISGELPIGEMDHINHIRSDNRRINLREASRADNMKNKSLQSNNVTGVTGVHLDRKTGKYRAKINVDGKRVSLGAFNDLRDAMFARKEAEIEYGYHPNHGANPPSGEVGLNPAWKRDKEALKVAIEYIDACGAEGGVAILAKIKELTTANEDMK